MRGMKETPLSENDPSRRQFLLAGLQVAASLPSCFSRLASAWSDQKEHDPFFKTQGMVLTTADLSTLDWPQRAAKAELTTIATHVTPSKVSRFIQTDRSHEFLTRVIRSLL